MQRLLGPIGLIALLAACSPAESEGDYVARVYDRYLSAEELAEHIPASVGEADSLKRAKVFINSWVKEQVVLQKAEFNLSEDDERFQRKLKAYLNDLMIFEYERSLVDQDLDTSFTDQELRAFYEENQASFQLKEPMVRFRALIIPDSVDGLAGIVAKFNDYDEADSLEVNTYVAQQELRLVDNPQRWHTLEYLLEVSKLNPEYFLKMISQKRVFDKHVDGRHHLIYVHEFRDSDALSPFPMQRERIRSILLNGRKATLLNEMRDRLFEDALSKGQIEIPS